MKQILWLVLLGFGVSGVGAVKQNCLISIQSQKKNGEWLNIVFRTKLQSPSECQRLAKLHSKNFTPDTIKTKSVKYAWQGNSVPRKQKASVARVNKRGLRKKNF